MTERAMTITFNEGETVWNGNPCGFPTLTLDDSSDTLCVDLCADLPDTEDGEKRSVNLVIPWDDLLAAVEFLRSAPASDD